MFVTLYVLYRVLAYLLKHLWSLASAPPLASPFRLTVGLVEKGVSITITHHPTTVQHVIVNIVTYTCTLIVFLSAARLVLVGSKVPANRALSYCTSLKQVNKAVKAAQKEIETVKDDLREMEGTSVITVEAFVEFRKLEENERELYLATEELLDVLDQLEHMNR